MLAALGKTLLKGKAKKIAKDKLLNRKKKTNKRRTTIQTICNGLFCESSTNA